ncbi:TPA: fimbria/pilus periplasmic chaperone [Escherichia coli]|nr:fimbria/pilus periplasmic chaperone [Escherichia coli]
MIGTNTNVFTPYLIQPRGASDNCSVPFIIIPQLFRLDGRQNNVLRVIQTGGILSVDRESLFWMNIKTIPSEEDTLQMRLKLIYQLTALKTLSFETEGRQASVTTTGKSINS